MARAPRPRVNLADCWPNLDQIQLQLIPSPGKSLSSFARRHERGARAHIVQCRIGVALLATHTHLPFL